MYEFNKKKQETTEKTILNVSQIKYGYNSKRQKDYEWRQSNV